MSASHLMIDLETMGTRYDAPILSIGAVFFDPIAGTLADQFYAKIAPEDALAHGQLDGATLKWWMAQAEPARTAAMSGSKTLAEALADLRIFIARAGPASPEDLRVWGNGATFDITILEYAFARLGVRTPWGFRGVRDCRTIKELAEGLVDPVPRESLALTEHDALDDAIYQAHCVNAQWRALRPPVEAA